MPPAFERVFPSVPVASRHRDRRASPTISSVTDSESVDFTQVAANRQDAPSIDGESVPVSGPPSWFLRVADAMRARPAWLALLFACVAWFILFGRLVWLRHARFATWDFDLGIHDQAIWLLAHGGDFVTVRGMSALGIHFMLAYFAVAPLYWIGGGPQLINLLQTAALAITAVPIFLYARDRLANEWHALAAASIWLLNPTVQWLCWEGWHPETMALPFLITAYLMASREKHLAYYAFLLAALSWKEDIALAVIMLGLLFLLRRRRRLGLITMAIGAAWFAVAYGVVMPHLNGGVTHAEAFYGDLGNSPSEIIRTGLTHPELVLRLLRDHGAVAYARDLLAPFGFVALLAPTTLLVAVPQFLGNILTTADFTYNIRFHYAAVIVAMVALATVEACARVRRLGLRRFAIGVSAAAALATTVAWGMSPLSTQFRDGYWALEDSPRHDVIATALALIPDEESVSATYHWVPHLSHREQIYTFPNPWIPVNWGVNGVAVPDPRHDHTPDEVGWIVLDTRLHQEGSREEALVDDLLDNGEFDVVFAEDGVLVARRVRPPIDP